MKKNKINTTMLYCHNNINPIDGTIQDLTVGKLYKAIHDDMFMSLLNDNGESIIFGITIPEVLNAYFRSTIKDALN